MTIFPFNVVLLYVNCQVDMYSLGVIFFELWHPFATAMERHLVLSDLKQKGDLPKSWAAQFPAQLNLLRRLLSPSPSDRPSAVEVLQSELPPRMEDEWLNGKSLKYYFIITERTGYDLIVDWNWWLLKKKLDWWILGFCSFHMACCLRGLLVSYTRHLWCALSWLFVLICRQCVHSIY